MGKVFLAGSGPGDPELITLKTYRLIQEADVIIFLMDGREGLTPADREVAGPGV